MQESAVEFNKPVHHGKIKQIVCQTILHIIILFTLFLILYPLVLLIIKSF